MSRLRSLILLCAIGCQEEEKPEPEDTSACSVADADGDGLSPCDGDCDDADRMVNPSSSELDGNGVDDDCDGVVDLGAADSGEDDTGGGDDTASEPCLDADLDGACQDVDCDDRDPTFYPGADELCDEQDNDCDGYTDEDALDAPTWHYDTDGDYYGDPESFVVTCDAPEGTVLNGEDCDDEDPGTNPGATEICDEEDKDEDCDDLADDLDESTDYVDTDIVYLDGDGDGHGDPSSTPQVACDADDETSETPTDCDDTDLEVHPDADEHCDGEDDDCDGAVDEPDAVDVKTWFADADSDGYGDAGSSEEACDAPEGMVADYMDCDDSRDDVHPGAPEYCDGADNDCDEVTDPDSSVDAATWYTDADGDGFGDLATARSSCTAPDGTVLVEEDCDDSRGDVNPDAQEVCDAEGADEDCDGAADDADGSVAAGTLVTWYHDADGDGYASSSDKVRLCDIPEDYLASAEPADCDDDDVDSYPDATEFCDYRDNDCDDQVDEDAEDATTWYKDHDGDGYGYESSSKASCTMPAGYVATSTDCDDDASGVHPGALERCATSADDDCDGSTESGAIDGSIWYRDSDGDGYGDSESSREGCERSGYVADDSDCNDSKSSVNPGEQEKCDASNTDEDCDGDADDEDGSATGQTEWFVDADGDGYGVSTEYRELCDKPTEGSYSSASTDCDDDEALINPGADDTVCNGLDDNCGTIVDMDGGEMQCETYDYDEAPYCQQVWGSVVNEFGEDVYHTYLFCSGPMTWDEAHGYCQEVGYHLVTIGDAAEQDMIEGWMDTWGASSAWIGLTDDTGRGKWSSQESMKEIAGYGYCADTSYLYRLGLIYTSWASGTPAEDSDDCITLVESGTVWVWQDAECTGDRRFICESCDPL